jgi:hypothetical protein
VARAGRDHEYAGSAALRGSAAGCPMSRPPTGERRSDGLSGGRER